MKILWKWWLKACPLALLNYCVLMFRLILPSQEAAEAESLCDNTSKALFIKWHESNIKVFRTSINLHFQFFVIKLRHLRTGIHTKWLGLGSLLTGKNYSSRRFTPQSLYLDRILKTEVPRTFQLSTINTSQKKSKSGPISPINSSPFNAKNEKRNLWQHQSEKILKYTETTSHGNRTLVTKFRTSLMRARWLDEVFKVGKILASRNSWRLGGHEIVMEIGTCQLRLRRALRHYIWK